MNKNVIIILSILLGLTGILYVSERQKNSEPLSARVSEKVDYSTTSSSALERSYLEGCMDGDEFARAYCQCTYDSLERMLGKEGVINMSLDYLDTGKLSSEMETAVYECIDLL